MNYFPSLQYNCVYPKNSSELEFILEHEKEITVETFKKNIGFENFNALEIDLGYDPRLPLRLNNDYHVRFYKSKKEDKTPVYFCRHSAIEYIYY